MLKDDLREIYQKQLERYPEFMKSKDLVTMGLFTSLADYSQKKKNGKIPPSILQNKRKLTFPKAALIHWLIEQTLDKDDLQL